MWMIELAINTMIADNKIGSQSAASETMRTSSLLQLSIKCRQTAFGPRGYSSPLPWSSLLECGVKRSDVLRSVNGTASKCKTFLATATEECCPAIGTLAGHFTRRLSPSPMPGKRIQQQRAYLPLKRSRPRPQFYRGTTSLTSLKRTLPSANEVFRGSVGGRGGELRRRTPYSYRLPCGDFPAASVGEQLAHQLGVQAVSGLARFDPSEQGQTNQRQVADQVERLVPHEFIVVARWPVEDAVFC